MPTKTKYEKRKQNPKISKKMSLGLETSFFEFFGFFLASSFVHFLCLTLICIFSCCYVLVYLVGGGWRWLECSLYGCCVLY